MYGNWTNCKKGLSSTVSILFLLGLASKDQMNVIYIITTVVQLSQLSLLRSRFLGHITQQHSPMAVNSKETIHRYQVYIYLTRKLDCTKDQIFLQENHGQVINYIHPLWATYISQSLNPLWNTPFTFDFYPWYCCTCRSYWF